MRFIPSIIDRLYANDASSTRQTIFRAPHTKTERRSALNANASYRWRERQFRVDRVSWPMQEAAVPQVKATSQEGPSSGTRA
ncbi:hypothetical protein Bphy_7364 (plasmid) [Paraburkholderia phymatum STM815]|uniref:Uncharacterized protein n=1 Tax=Paraburkholderia phymatum (strain DSM 17167 / CIP 108236 / LMG 21445 / STM815) TaxID=391038 RepID=B2JXI6_PARP8|nr:hypothetical protein Bphy_7364 [Paraburkholderia phymatum STM815]